MNRFFRRFVSGYRPGRLFLVSMLLAGVPRADTAAVVAVDEEKAGAVQDAVDEAAGTVGVLHWDQRLVTGGDFQPSQRLILEAIRQRQSVLYVWEGTDFPAAQPFTARGNVDWAFCTPVPGKACRGWGLRHCAP